MASQYTAKQFIDATAGTGGIISEIAARVGCSWNTAKKYIEEYPTVYRAWINERQRINDIARSNIIDDLESGNVQTSKWWLQVLDPEFMPKQRQEVTGGEQIVIVRMAGFDNV